jgi:hypothetical protein
MKECKRCKELKEVLKSIYERTKHPLSRLSAEEKKNIELLLKNDETL